ncbi:MAG: hypothetical protein IEMM0006_1827 [bacterium]|nr:MAG: hypothetical protein IEMM0006_1827 [bacterium]
MTLNYQNKAIRFEQMTLFIFLKIIVQKKLLFNNKFFFDNSVIYFEDCNIKTLFQLPQI